MKKGEKIMVRLAEQAVKTAALRRIEREDREELEREAYYAAKNEFNGELRRYAIYCAVNPNAHNPRYGRDINSPSVIRGYVMAGSAVEAQMEAALSGITYCPDQGQYNWLFDWAELAPE